MCKNELFKVQGQKTNFMQSLETKTILLPLLNYKNKLDSKK
jgi:hypothetical protein